MISDAFVNQSIVDKVVKTGDPRLHHGRDIRPNRSRDGSFNAVIHDKISGVVKETGRVVREEFGDSRPNRLSNAASSLRLEETKYTVWQCVSATQ